MTTSPGWDKQKITVAQQRILDLLNDNKPHALIPELIELEHYNQFPAIDALERKGLIEKVIDQGYYSRWAKK